MNHVDNPFESPSILSLCPGVRGLERGIERAIGRINVIAYVEIEAFIIANLVAEMEKGFLAPAPIWSDIKTFNAKPFRNKVHGIIGGYPCQPFSNAGARKGTIDPRHLYPFISGIIKATGPVWCFFENVAGHLTLGYPEVSTDLRSMGYAVEAGIYSAEEVGAPHQRDRLFILAIKQEFLEHTRSPEPNRVSSFKWEENTQVGNSGDVVDPPSPGKRGRTGNISEENGRQIGELPLIPKGASRENELADTKSELSELSGNSREWWTRFTDNSSHEQKLAHSSHSGLQRGEWRRALFNQGQTPLRPITECSFNGWPARPGQQQYDWEEPRTIKPGMGSTFDGYNFREDLLRAYGNSVVEQTAEIAMIDLLKKHGLG